MRMLLAGVFAFAAALANLRAQQPWSASVSPVTQTLWGATFGNNLFVAVGEGGAIVTSPDGLAWTARASGTDKWLLAATWSPTLKTFVVVGDAGTILTSPDGITWTPRTSGTTQRLNSVAWNSRTFTYPDVFLAVGENGTALTSSDLATWTPHATGDTGWLRGIVKGTGNDSFIVTGHDGTILTTSDDGETFQHRASGTALHLDAVAWLDDNPTSSLYATGTNFVFTRSTDRGATWTPDRTVNTDGRENGYVYNALVAFNHAAVIAGDVGRIIDEFGRPWRTTEPLVAGWRAVAASADRVVAVGTSGAIASAPLDPDVPHELAITKSFLVDSIVLHAATVRNANDLSGLQWSFNGNPIPGANSATLTLNSQTAARNGTYTVTATFTTILPGAIFVTSTSTASITLAPAPNPSALNVIDTPFHPVLAAAPRFITPLADGRVYVAGVESALLVNGALSNGPVRLKADGSLDVSFHVPDGAIPAGSTQAMMLQPDGRLVVLVRGANFPPVQYFLVRLNTDGSVDPSFKPDAALANAGTPPILLSDGRWLAVRSEPTGLGAYPAVLRRFLADGSADSSFTPVVLVADGFFFNSGTFLFNGPQVISTLDAQNRVYLGVRYGDFYSTLSAHSGKSKLFRLTTDGRVDTTFSSVDVEPLQALQATSAGLVARSLTTTWSRLAPYSYTSALFRLSFDGSRDASFKTTTASWTQNAPTQSPEGVPDGFNIMTVATDGTIVARSIGRRGHFGLVRFRSDGAFDGDFAAELGPDAASITAIAPQADGRVLVAGTFNTLVSVAQPWLARITPNTTAATTRLSNVSVRARTGTGASTLIAGYITAGGDTSVLARAAGPALQAFNVADPLPDPQLALFAGAAQISGNDNWGDGPAAFLAATATRLGAFPFATGSLDAALYTTAPAGAYTVQVAGKNSTSGVALAELYDATPRPANAQSPRVKDFSVRSASGSGADTLIVGFTLDGDNTRNVVLRAIGPSLAKFGLTDTLPDPVITLFRSATAVAANDDWAVDTDTRLLMLEAFDTVGAFPLDYQKTYPYSASKDAAMLVSLTPGNYTVQVSGKNGASGVVLLELYEVP